MEDSKRRRHFFKMDKRSETQVYISSKEYQEIYFQTRQFKKKMNECCEAEDIKSAIIRKKRQDKLKLTLKRNRSSEFGK